MGKLKQGPEPPWDGNRFPWPPPPLTEWMEIVRAKEDPEWIIPGILPYDAAVLISGAAKRAFKTWLVFLVVICVVLGRALVSCLEPTAALKVLVIELEGPEKQTLNRWDWLLAPFREALQPDTLWFIHRYPLLIDDPEHLQLLCDFVKEKGIKLIVIDTLAKANTGDENSVKEMSRTMRAFDLLRHAMDGGSVIYLHHLRKPADRPDTDIDDDIRGSSALAGFYDVHWAIRKRSEDQPWLDLTVRQSDDEERYFRVQWSIDKELGEASASVEPYDPENVSPEMLTQARAVLLEGAEYTLTALQDLWGYGKEMTKAVRDALVEEGELKRLARGKVMLT